MDGWSDGLVDWCKSRFKNDVDVAIGKTRDRIFACISRFGVAIGAAAAIEQFIFRSRQFLQKKLPQSANIAAI